MYCYRCHACNTNVAFSSANNPNGDWSSSTWMNSEGVSGTPSTRLGTSADTDSDDGQAQILFTKSNYDIIF